MESQRVRKVQKLTKEVLGEAIGELKDPRIGFTTITSVKVTRDLHLARVFVSVLGDEAAQAETMEGLRSASRLLRIELGRQMRAKFTPELVFELDHTPQDADRLERLISTLKQEDAG
jgi:ribosome-binding factor A